VSMHEVDDGHWRLRVFAGRENGKAATFPAISGDQATGAGRTGEVGDRG
jgi:hypothetical protein